MNIDDFVNELQKEQDNAPIGTPISVLFERWKKNAGAEKAQDVQSRCSAPLERGDV